MSGCLDEAARRLDSDRTHVAAYRYDGDQPGNGNRTAVLQANGDTVLTATYDAHDRMLRYEPEAYRYTDNGELKEITRPGPVTSPSRYDVFGNLAARGVTPNLPRCPQILRQRIFEGSLLTRHAQAPDGTFGCAQQLSAWGTIGHACGGVHLLW